MGPRETEVRTELEQLQSQVLGEMVGAYPADAPVDRKVLERTVFEGATIQFLVGWIQRLAAEVDELREAVASGDESG